MIGATQLHLPNLAIEGFRGIDTLSIRRLGQVTLLAGRNAAGKTTVLDAVRVYASRGHFRVLSNLLRGRGELTIIVDEEGKSWYEPDWSALFHGRDPSEGARIAVRSGGDELAIEDYRASLEEESLIRPLPFEFVTNDHMRVLRVTFQGRRWFLPCLMEGNTKDGNVLFDRSRWRRGMRLRQDDSIPPQFTCESLGPGTLTDAELARFWDAVTLTEDENEATRALRLVLGESVDRVSVVGAGNGTGHLRGGPRVIVKRRGFRRPVPLQSLGDGALRLYGVALAIANSKNGFLLMDEAENGIHHSVQRDFWRMILRTALGNNVQVLATTHSWDCVRGFAEAAAENEDAEGVLVRLDRLREGIRSVEYSEEELIVAAEQDIEVR